MQGFFRYWSPDIKVFLRELSHAESEKESLLKSTFQRLIGRFCEHHTKWKQLVSTTAGTYCGPSESFCHGCAITQLLAHTHYKVHKPYLRLFICCTAIRSIN